MEQERARFYLDWSLNTSKSIRSIVEQQQAIDGRIQSDLFTQPIDRPAPSIDLQTDQHYRYI